MKSGKEKFFYRNRYVIFSFFVSALILLVIYAIRGIFPFGDRTILRVDLYHQYAPFLEELRSRILNGQSLFYSWEGGLGKEFLPQMAYYTASPFSFLILLFPSKLLPEALLILISLKICLCASSFSYYLKEHFHQNHYSVLLFGLLYGFCSFVTCYYWNVMWLDTVYLFPILALGTERLIHENRHILYCLTLTLTMIVNFYMAVLVCIFIALYFLVVLFSGYTWKENRKLILSRMIRFAVFSILAAVSSLFVLYPVALALGQTATSETAFPGFGIYSNVAQLLVNNFLGARPAVLARNEDLPNIYSGVLTVMLLPVYYLNRSINPREKRLVSALLIFLLLCCCIQPLDFLVHGLHFPSNLPHRFTFIYSFLVLYLAYQGFLHIKECDFRLVIFTVCASTALILVSEYVIVNLVPDIDVTLSDMDICLNIVLMILYSGILFCLIRKNDDSLRFLPGILFVCVVCELLYSGADGICDTGDRQAYTAYMEDTEKAISYMEEREEGNFCRAEFRRFTTINDACLYHYPGFSVFSSLTPGGISKLVSNLGIAATGNSYRFYDPSPLINSIFGLKYVMNKDSEIANTDLKYTYLEQFGDVWVYENDRPLSLGFMVNPEITDWEMSEKPQPFEVQNQFARLAAGIDEELFTPLSASSIVTENMETTPRTDGENCFDYTLPEPANLSLEPKVTAVYTSDCDQYLYLYVDASNAKRFIYHTSRENQDRELSAGNSLIDVGYVHEGETVTIEFLLTNRGEFEKTYRENGTVRLYAAAWHDEVFQKVYEKLQGSQYTINDFQDTRIAGTVSTSQSGILFTSIPYVDGWEITIDGEPADKVSIADDGVIGVRVPAGEHTIVFTYRLKGFALAVLLSILGQVSVLLSLLITGQRNRHHVPSKNFRR